MKTTMRRVHGTIFSLLGITLFLIPFNVAGFGQTPSNALQFVANIPVPNWATSGPNQVSVDIVTFDPQSGVVYIADHVNDGALAIDTHTRTALGIVSPPGCGFTARKCVPSGVVVAPDLRKLVFTGSTPPSLWVYDLRVPGAPVPVTVPAGPDLIDYDPINHYVYVKHSRQVSVVDLVNLKVVAQIPLTVASQQPRFNPVDGFIYLTLTDSVAKIDPIGNTVVTTFPLRSSTGVTCSPNDFAIDPVTNTAFVACGGTGPAMLMDLSNGNILSTYPQLTGSDSIAFDARLRHFYSASNANTNSNGLCPADSTKAFTSIGVVSITPTPTAQGQFVGVACSGRGIQVAADPINHDVYAASIQFPVDASSPNTGQPGVLVFHDPADPATDTPPVETQAVLSPVAATGSGVQGTVIITRRERNVSVATNLTGLPAGSAAAELVLTTTVGNEVVGCDNGFCQDRLIGDVLTGGVVDVGLNGVLVAGGTIKPSCYTVSGNTTCGSSTLGDALQAVACGTHSPGPSCQWNVSQWNWFLTNKIIPNAQVLVIGDGTQLMSVQQYLQARLAARIVP